MLGLNSYNYGHFSRELFHDLARTSFSGPAPGEHAPDFKAVSLDGETVRLSDYAKKKNVLLIFGSATCPMTAASIGEINELYDRCRGDDIEFLFIYVREAHPGEIIPAHSSMREKTEAARLLRDEEDMHMPVLVDDLRGSIHRKYSKLPNPAFLIDKSGRVAFLSLWSRSAGLGHAIQELLDIQEERSVDRAVNSRIGSRQQPDPLCSRRSRGRNGRDQRDALPSTDEGRCHREVADMAHHPRFVPCEGARPLEQHGAGAADPR